ncbi:hypothetical protein [Capnocytophaga sp.]|uniref:hypothetical protein n=1 Tax=Capnocytophaga sp. TaxID=44737 RepID=UPI0026DB311C|nr:hypothetical protein [Capnocytophaga sp.]MDO5104858.1 hypothetical protein [Capnocytophaga sp.]
MEIKMFFTLLLLAVMGCSGSSQVADVLTVNGEIIYEGTPDSGGCGWLVKTTRNEFFAMENIQENFKEKGLRVKLTYTKKNDFFVCSSDKKYEIIIIINVEKL